MEIQQLPEENRDRIIRLCILLRLAVLLNRSRSYASPPDITASVKERAIQLEFPGQWLNEHPLTKTDLEQETEYLETVDYKLNYVLKAE